MDRHAGAGPGPLSAGPENFATPALRGAVSIDFDECDCLHHRTTTQHHRELLLSQIISASTFVAADVAVDLALGHPRIGAGVSGWLVLVESDLVAAGWFRAAAFLQYRTAWS